MKIAVRSILAVLVISSFTYHSALATAVPEIDPGTGVGALALLGGAVMVLRGRRRS